MGIFSSCQFFGIFIGGIVGGVVYHHWHIAGVLSFCLVLGILWLIVCATMAEPTYLNSKIYKLNCNHLDTKKTIEEILASQIGVYEYNTCLEEPAIYIKIDKKEFNEHNLLQKIKKFIAN